VSAAVDTPEFTAEVTEAVRRLAGVIERTPLQRKARLSEATESFDGAAGVHPCDHLHRHVVGEQQGGVGGPEVVQPDHRRQLLRQRLARPEDVAGEAAREPLRVPWVPSRVLSTSAESRTRST
jgi:diadenosine tetraphosphate (Ap4A) HIT family hydrolase